MGYVSKRIYFNHADDVHCNVLSEELGTYRRWNISFTHASANSGIIPTVSVGTSISENHAARRILPEILQSLRGDQMVNAALNIVAAFKALHNKGYNYQDLNDGNFFIEPRTGDVLICDNDNVMGYGQSSGVLGKARYMAPEVVRGDIAPNKPTDRFSLAVILFMLLVGDHPLEGAKTNVPALTNKYDKKFFGIEPLFIFDEYNSANMPVQGLHKNAIAFWPCFPKFIQKAFMKSFSQESLLKAHGRLQEQEWFHLLVQLKSSIVKCPKCGSEMFLESNGETICPDCKNRVKSAGYLRFLKRRSNLDIKVPIFEGVRLFKYHMSDTSDDYQSEAATVLAKPGKLGLQNNSGLCWKLLYLPLRKVYSGLPGPTAW